jgi:hypothetical protein
LHTTQLESVPVLISVFTLLWLLGRVIGSHNGDVQNHEPNDAPWHSAYHGLVRGIVQVTTNSAGPAWHRHRLAQIDTDHAPRTKLDASSDASESDASAIVVEASSPGLPSVRVSIAVSTDPSKDGVLATAAANVGRAYVFDTV